MTATHKRKILTGDLDDLLGAEPMAIKRSAERPRRSTAEPMGGDSRSGRYSAASREASASVSGLEGRLSEADLAEFWGVSSRMVRKLGSDGTIEKFPGNRFDLRAATRAYIQRLIKVAEKRGTADPELRAEKLRLTREQADAAGLKNAAARGELLEASAVEKTWASILTDIRAAMLAIPSRLPMLDRSTLEIIDREIRDALTEAAQ